MKKSLLLVAALALAAAGSASAAVEPPVPIRTVSPAYPSAMRQQGINGIVAVSLIVDEHGVVQDPKVVKATDDSFAEPALDAVRKWKFKPGERDGTVVAMRVTIPIKFTAAENS